MQPKVPELKTKRKIRKVPSWHFTSKESMEFIQESNERTTAKEKKVAEKAQVKHQALLAHRRKKHQATKVKK